MKTSTFAFTRSHPHLPTEARTERARARSHVTFADPSPVATAQLKLQALANDSTHVSHLIRLQQAADANRTGLPDHLKAGVEQLSGFSLDHIHVHYNSPRPAGIQALAYTEGSDIHVGPGQERHLAHEAWHAVQQMQGRVKPTLHAHDTAINDDPALEREADVMGARALQVNPGGRESLAKRADGVPVERGAGPVQRRVGFEFQTPVVLRNQRDSAPPLKRPLYTKPTWHIECDSGDLEFVTEPLSDVDEVDTTMAEIVQWVRSLQQLAMSYDRGTLDRIATFEALIAEARLDGDLRSVEDYEETLNAIRQDDQKRALGQMAENRGTDLEPLFVKGRVAPLTAAPQTTVGLSLDRIISAMHLIASERYTLGASSNSPHTVELAGMTNEAAPTMISAHDETVKLVNKLRERHANVEEASWRSLEGILSLAASYIRTAQPARRSAYSYAKQIAPLMSRMNFGAIHARLPREVAAFFTADNLAAAAGVGPNDFVFGSKGVKPNVKGPTVAEWVESIQAGQDALSVHGVHEATATITDGSESMGQETDVDEDGLIPLELRRISKSVPVEHWAELARETFIFAKALMTAQFY